MSTIEIISSLVGSFLLLQITIDGYMDKLSPFFHINRRIFKVEKALSLNTDNYLVQSSVVIYFFKRITLGIFDLLSYLISH